MSSTTWLDKISMEFSIMEFVKLTYEFGFTALISNLYNLSFWVPIITSCPSPSWSICSHLFHLDVVKIPLFVAWPIENKFVHNFGMYNIFFKIPCFQMPWTSCRTGIFPRPCTQRCWSLAIAIGHVPSWIDVKFMKNSHLTSMCIVAPPFAYQSLCMFHQHIEPWMILLLLIQRSNYYSYFQRSSYCLCFQICDNTFSNVSSLFVRGAPSKESCDKGNPLKDLVTKASLSDLLFDTVTFVSFLLLISWLYSSSLDIRVTSVQLPHMSCTSFWISNPQCTHYLAKTICIWYLHKLKLVPVNLNTCDNCVCFLSWNLTSFCHRYFLSHLSVWAYKLLKLMTNICENSMKNYNLYSLKHFLLYMQVLLHKNVKLKRILISVCTQKTY